MRKGFTLIELVMVIVILGILAATALPRFISLQADAQESAAKGSLGALRAAVAIEYARTAVSGTASYPTAAQINNGIDTDGDGELESMFADNQVPENPYHSSRVVQAVAAVPAVVGDEVAGDVGWLYQESSGRVWINHFADGGFTW